MEYRFLESENTAVITTRSIVNGKKDIKFVSHDEDDGMWQFLDGGNVTKENAAVVSLSEIVEIDNTVNDLYDLPLGWIAYRKRKSAKWKRSINY